MDLVQVIDEPQDVVDAIFDFYEARLRAFAGGARVLLNL